MKKSIVLGMVLVVALASQAAAESFVQQFLSRYRPPTVPTAAPAGRRAKAPAAADGLEPAARARGGGAPAR